MKSPFFFHKGGIDVTVFASSGFLLSTASLWKSEIVK